MTGRWGRRAGESRQSRDVSADLDVGTLPKTELIFVGWLVAPRGTGWVRERNRTMAETIRQWAERYLYERGMFPDQAKAVVDAVEADNEPMKGRWNHATDGYPHPLLAVLTFAIDAAAVEWIDANLPRAWYRSIFAHEEPPNAT
jgi:hypothetical protein